MDVKLFTSTSVCVCIYIYTFVTGWKKQWMSMFVKLRYCCLNKYYKIRDQIISHMEVSTVSNFFSDAEKQNRNSCYLPSSRFVSSAGSLLLWKMFTFPL